MKDWNALKCIHESELRSRYICFPRKMDSHLDRLAHTVFSDPLDDKTSKYESRTKISNDLLMLGTS